MYILLMAIGLTTCLWILWETIQAPGHASRGPFLVAAISGAGWYALGIGVALSTTPAVVSFLLYVSPLVIVPTFWATLLFIATQIGAIDRNWHKAAFSAIALWTVFLLILHQVPSLRWTFADYTVWTGPDETILWERQTGLFYLPVLFCNLVGYLSTAALVVRTIIRSRGVHRRQSIGMLIGTLMPFTTYVLQAVLPGGGGDADPMLLSFLPASLIFYWLTVRQHVLTLAPIPRHLLIDAIPDAIFVTHTDGRILEANRAARDLGGLPYDVIGRRISEFGQLADALSPCLAGETANADVQLSRSGEAEARSYAVTATPYVQAACARSLILTLSDITARVELERRLQETAEALERRLEENQMLHEKLLAQAIRDPLTGLYNRYHSMAVHKGLMEAAVNSGEPLAAALMDVDHFKAVNDQLGHQTGDQVLSILGEVFRDHTPQGVLVFRYGGEEFLALMPGYTAEMAGVLVSAWRHEFRLRTTMRVGVMRTVDFSAGLAVYPDDADEWAAFIDEADSALYAAKSTGRGRTCVWNSVEPLPLAETPELTETRFRRGRTGNSKTFARKGG